MVKRAFDLIVTTVALIVLAPLMGVVALAVLLKLGRPVIFRQQRTGLHAETFDVLKFRSMLDLRGPDGERLPNAQRLTRFGVLLRASSLDELPSLWNVVSGEMSLVGPRPLLPEYVPLYNERQARRHDVRPGITGWAQVNGRNALSWEQKFDLDVWYVDNRSLALDLRILAMTLWKVVRKEGITHGEDAAMPRFKGSEPR